MAACNKDWVQFKYLPHGRHRIWRLTLTRDEKRLATLVIYCDNQKVLKFVPSEKVCDSSSNWKEAWKREVSGILFSIHDTASDYITFRPGY